ncbi:hypothetical protein P0R31_11775 [Bradyrhizobium yuanmingense]|uniref:hypothetical protein n=1 Tax=Bradyrhizobium yuanmingense TaxID=108015 RepID=UPI0023B8CBB4|nr:hypothetical protein [Bradyrhizobium yuanmingense]MDF0517910.1 hypothetical protein [Bradyrhizobium yuanmingense]
MIARSYGALFASLSAAALLISSSDSPATPAGATASGVAAVAAPPVAARPPIGPGARFHRRSAPWVYWPGGGGYYYDGAGYGQPFADVNQALSADVRYTYTYDVPWDWTHRYPPNVVPSNRPYVPSCPTEQVTVPGRGGSEHTVNIMRCY